MPNPNIPNDKHDARIYLLGNKQALIDLAIKILDHKMNTASQISGTIFTEIEDLDKKLELY